ncbi:MAG: VOC family protein [Fuerstiella sp.]
MKFTVRPAATCSDFDVDVLNNPSAKLKIMPPHEKINYVEFASTDLSATKQFFESVFGWEFVDYGPDYTAFSNEGLDGGFYRADLRSTYENGGALIVFFSEQLEQTLGKVEQQGGRIVKPIFSFPGGRRFHFAEPCGNEFAVWSDV